MTENHHDLFHASYDMLRKSLADLEDAAVNYGAERARLTHMILTAVDDVLYHSREMEHPAPEPEPAADPDVVIRDGMNYVTVTRLAELSGYSRNTLNNLVRQWQNEELQTTDGKPVVIPNCPRPGAPWNTRREVHLDWAMNRLFHGRDA